MPARWLGVGLNQYGEPHERYPQPADPTAAAVILAGLMVMPRLDRGRWRKWFLRWTDKSGRIILPQDDRRSK